jgi:hypothetical protein
VRRVLLTSLAVAALAGAASASANNYIGTLADGGVASISGTFIKCRVGGGVVGCVPFKGGKPDQSAWAFTINDSVIQAGKVSADKPAYTSPKQPKAGGKALTGGVKALVVKDGQNFGVAGTHVACSSVKVTGKTGVVCTLLDTKGVVAGSYGVVLTSHAIQVRTAAGSKSKVLFSKTF